MIRRITESADFAALPRNGVEACKIRAMLYAYGAGDKDAPDGRFPVFFAQVSGGLPAAYIGAFGGSFVLCRLAADGAIMRTDELAEFLSFGGYSDVFCDDEAGAALAAALGADCERVNLMRFRGELRGGAVLPPPKNTATELEKEPPLSEVYAILSPAFGMEFEPWYLDMSHRVRHGVSRVRRLRQGALVIQHDINGEALLSQVAVQREFRGQGLGSALVRAVCAELSDSDVYVLCDDATRPFYEKNGFSKCAAKRIITRRG